MPTGYVKSRRNVKRDSAPQQREIAAVDIDGTAYNFHGAVKAYLEEMGHTFYPEKCIDYHFNGDIGCDKQLIYDSFDKKELYDKLKAYEGSIEAINLLRQHGTVYGYTASVAEPSIFNQRVKLVEELGMIPKVFVKHKPVIDADALFDDCLGVHRCWIAANSNAKLYLIDQPHNRMTEENKDDPIWQRVIRCNSLLEAVQLYLSDIDE